MFQKLRQQQQQQRAAACSSVQQPMSVSYLLALPNTPPPCARMPPPLLPKQIGPARPILDSSSDSSVQQLAERFNAMLSGFESHPWTLQRLCELLLEPQKQYKRLHKLVSSTCWQYSSTENCWGVSCCWSHRSSTSSCARW
jgi:hypothetical protein